MTKNQYMLLLSPSSRSSRSTRFATFSRRKYEKRGEILAITLEATPGTHDEGRLVLALVRGTGLFLSFGEPLSYGKLLFRGLSIGSGDCLIPILNDRGALMSINVTDANIAHEIISQY